jgi:hypothetical protein
MELNHILIDMIYSKKETWSRLCFRAGVIDDFDNTNEKEIYSVISNKWLSTNSTSYFHFILKVAKQGFNIKLNDFDENGKTMLLMLYYDVWQKHGLFNSLEESIKAIGKNIVLINEIIEVLELLIDKVDFKENEITLPYSQPLKLHARYTREQILVAFGMSTFEKKYISFEGAAENVSLSTEILFINLIKSEASFSPTTMYDDYAISETLFHWQSHNAYRPDKGKGLSYITHEENDKKIVLFVREKANDENGNTIGYVFIGEGIFMETEGSKPMNVTWELKEPMPEYLWKASAKMSTG